MGGVVESIGNGLGIDIGGSGSKDAALRTMDGATARAEDMYKDEYTNQRGIFNPYNDAGRLALSQLTSGNLQMDPGYQFRLNQGLTGIDRAMAARGMGNSGRALKALTQYNQDFASNEYGNAYNRLSSIAGMGFNAANGLANASQNYARSYGDLQLNRANGNMAAEAGYQNRLSGLVGQGIQGGMMAMGAMGGVPPMPAAIPSGGGAQTQVMPQQYSSFTGLSGYKLPSYGGI